MIELKLPELGENIDHAEVSRVLISEGDMVQVDQNVLELESEKASFPLPSTHAGKVANKILNAAYGAFGSGLHLALDISAILLICGAVVAVTTIHRDRGERYDI